MCFKIIIFRQNTSTNQFFLQNLYKVQQIFRVLVADVINCIRRNGQTIFTIFTFRRTLHHTDNALDNIIHISKVTLAVTVVENLNRFAFQQLVSKAEVRHIRATSRAIYCEESQTSGRNVIQLRVGMSHQFIRFLGCRIQRYRVINLVIRAVRHFLITAIDRRTGCINQMLHRSMAIIIRMAAGFQNVIETNQVCFHICIRVCNRITNASLST